MAGAKTAMALALQSPGLVRNIISVDNAPVDAVLESGFGRYIEGMKRIEKAGVMRQAEAEEILKDYEPVFRFSFPPSYNATTHRYPYIPTEFLVAHVK
ncbi:hypothetical protein ACHAQH_006851 [Verticillium albo-atrum]